MECKDYYQFPQGLSKSLESILSRGLKDIPHERTQEIEDRILGILQSSILKFYNPSSPRELHRSEKSEDIAHNSKNLLAFATAIADDKEWQKTHLSLTGKVMHAAKKIYQKSDKMPSKEIVSCIKEIEQYNLNKKFQRSIIYMIATNKLSLQPEEITNLSNSIKELSTYDFKASKKFKSVFNSLFEVQTDKKTTFSTISHLLYLLSTNTDISFILKDKGFLDKIVEYGIANFAKRDIANNFLALIDKTEVSQYIHQVKLDGKKLSLEDTQVILDKLTSLEKLDLHNYSEEIKNLKQLSRLASQDCEINVH